MLCTLYLCQLLASNQFRDVFFHLVKVIETLSSSHVFWFVPVVLYLPVTRLTHTTQAPTKVVQSCLELGAAGTQQPTAGPAVVFPHHEGELDPALLAGGAEGVGNPDWS